MGLDWTGTSERIHTDKAAAKTEEVYVKLNVGLNGICHRPVRIYQDLSGSIRDLSGSIRAPLVDLSGSIRIYQGSIRDLSGIYQDLSGVP